VCYIYITIYITMDSSKNAIDLLNVDYDDVLHLYRGWRRSEGLLQDKNKELACLKGRIKQLQDSHVKFRSQIQALESVKELTVTLQTQLSIFQQENIQLLSENKELLELGALSDQRARQATEDLAATKAALHSAEVRGENMKGRYEEATASSAELERLASAEQAGGRAAETRLKEAEALIEQLQREKHELQGRVQVSQSRAEDTNRELGEVAKQLKVYSNEVSELGVTREQLCTAEAERDIVKGDISRLLRLLEHYPAAKGFVKRWQDNQGLSFIGTETSSHSSRMNQSSSRMNDTSLQTGGGSLSPRGGGGDGEEDLSPEELAHLKRLHGNKDPYPMAKSMQVRHGLDEIIHAICSTCNMQYYLLSSGYVIQ
jgi:chromosome segregation ATPase